MSNAQTDWMLAVFRDRATMVHERYFAHPIERVWEAVTTSELDGRPWLSLGKTVTKALEGRAVVFDPPRTVQYASVHPESALRFELRAGHHPQPYGHVDAAESTGTHLWLIHSCGPVDVVETPEDSYEGADLPAGPGRPWRPAGVAGLHEFLDQVGLWLDGRWFEPDNVAYHTTRAGHDQRARWIDSTVHTSGPTVLRSPPPSISKRYPVPTIDRTYVRRDERVLISLSQQAAASPELNEMVMALPPEQRLTATFVHFVGSAERPQLVEIWVPPGARIQPHPQEAHGIGYVIGGEMHVEGQVLGAGSSFFVPTGVAFSYQAGPQGITFLGFRPVRPRDTGLRALPSGPLRPVVRGRRIGVETQVCPGRGTQMGGAPGSSEG